MAARVHSITMWQRGGGDAWQWVQDKQAHSINTCVIVPLWHCQIFSNIVDIASARPCCCWGNIRDEKLQLQWIDCAGTLRYLWHALGRGEIVKVSRNILKTAKNCSFSSSSWEHSKSLQLLWTQSHIACIFINVWCKKRATLHFSLRTTMKICC